MTTETSQGMTTAARAKLIGAGTLIVVAVVFIVENGRKTRIRFIVPEVRTYLWLALLIAFALGLLSGLLLARYRSRR